MLLNTFEMYSQANKRMLIFEMNKINDSLLEMEYLDKIKGPLINSIRGAILTKEEYPRTVTRIANESKVPENIVKELISKYKIQRLLTFKTDTHDLNEKMVILQSNLAELNKFVLDKYR